jgi:hypothetical protein
MKFVYCIILLACLFAFVKAQSDNGDSFCITFYRYPHNEQENGVICGNVSPGGSAGSPKRGNITIGSFEAPDWLQVTIFEDYYYRGKSHVYVGSQKDLSPVYTLHSVKWKHL